MSIDDVLWLLPTGDSLLLEAVQFDYDLRQITLEYRDSATDEFCYALYKTKERELHFYHKRNAQIFGDVDFPGELWLTKEAVNYLQEEVNKRVKQ